MIQVITSNQGFFGRGVKVSHWNEIERLDDYEITVIDLKDSMLLREIGFEFAENSLASYFTNLKRQMNQSVKTTYVFLLPQNMKFDYQSKILINLQQKMEIKNNLDLLMEVFSALYPPLRYTRLLYQPSKTVIYDYQIPADFCFSDDIAHVYSRCLNDLMPTTIRCKDAYVTTLDIVLYEQLIAFLEYCQLITPHVSLPNWLEQFDLFDDVFQREVIDQQMKIIETSYQKIQEAKVQLVINQRYKSILILGKEHLRFLVLEMLEKIFEEDLIEYFDMKQGIFHFEVEETIFVGMIRSSVKPLKREHVAKLDVIMQRYLDEHHIHQAVVSLLVVNMQRDKPLHQRKEISQEIIDLAIRNKALMIDTYTFLQLFHQYMTGQISKEEVIHIFRNNVGILRL